MSRTTGARMTSSRDARSIVSYCGYLKNRFESSMRAGCRHATSSSSASPIHFTAAFDGIAAIAMPNVSVSAVVSVMNQ